MHRTTLSLGLLLASTATLATPANAQQVFGPSKDWKLRVVDLGAGALSGEILIDVQATAQPSQDGVYSLGPAALVDDELWVLGNKYEGETALYRYDRATLALLGRETITGRGTCLEAAGGSAWMGTASTLVQLSLDGQVLAVHPVPSASDVLEYNGELLVANRQDERIDRYDLSGQLLGVFADPSHPLFLEPQRLARKANGDVLVLCSHRVFDLDPAGNIVEEIYGNPAQDVVETSSGLACIAQGTNNPVVGPVTVGWFWTLASPGVTYFAPYEDGSRGDVRFCPATPSSTGDPVTILAVGSDKVARNDFALCALGAPPLSYGLFLYGDRRAPLPFGDGLLCINPFTSGLFRLPPAILTSYGSLQQDFDFASAPPGGQIVPGSTWTFQLLYRDAAGGTAGFNLSDAVAVTFR